MLIGLPHSMRGHASRLLIRLERDTFPALGNRDLRAVTSADVLATVRRVEARGREVESDETEDREQEDYELRKFASP